MKRPWQIWLLYAICLAVVLPAMGWLTRKVLELDQAEAQARRQAELEEITGSALWRMDSELTQLLAQEAARPYFVYRPFFAAAKPTSRDKGGKGGKRKKAAVQETPSPLLVQPSELVVLHFQLTADNRVSSPQCPPGELCEKALACGVLQENIDSSWQKLKRLQTQLNHQQILACLPVQTLPTAQTGVGLWPGNYDLDQANQSPVMRNTIDVDPVQEQWKAQQAAQKYIGPQPMQEPRNQAETPGQMAQGFNYEQSRQQRSRSRAGKDLENRTETLQKAARQQVIEQRLNLGAAELLDSVSEGVSKPLWFDSRLLLARRVLVGEDVVIQGCWLDWPKIKQHLQRNVKDLLPAIDLKPVTDKTPEEEIQFSRLLATIPAQLVVIDSPNLLGPQSGIGSGAGLSPLKVSLAAAWICLIFVLAAVAVLLRGAVALSERRAAFVSAVTHELRTPLTTFRMYAEMLAEGMVPDEQKRRRYLQTLHIEADRLAHLVENVLSYARLERGRVQKRRETLSLGELLDRIARRLEDRAEQAEMKLCLEIAEEVRLTKITTDPAAVEQILFNLVDNACKYASNGKDLRIHLLVENSPGPTWAHVKITVSDHGPGISGRDRRRLFQPFSKSAQEAANSAPGVGLGLSLCRRLARQLGGRLEMAPGPLGRQRPCPQGAAFVLKLPK